MNAPFNILRSAAIAIALCAIHTAVAAPPVVTVTGITPDPGVLAGSQNFYARVSYESDQPLRFQAAGYLDGKLSDGLAMNPSPVYPAGKGEAIVWVFGLKDTRIDTLHVRVCDAGWKQLVAVPVATAIEWRSSAPEAPTAAWAAELSAAQQRAVSEAMKAEPQPSSLLGKIWIAIVGLLVPLAFLSTPAYPLFQIYALVKLRGTSRLISVLPLVFMLPIYGYTALALSKGSNLWPLFAIFASPVALIIVIVVMVVARRRAQAEEA